MRRFVPILALAALTSCTSSEVDRWLSWWHDDPEAAESFANQDWVQRSLEWGCESYCDVDDPDLQQPQSAESSQSSDNQSDGDVPDEDFPTIEGTACEGWSDTALAVGWSVDQWYEPLSRIMARESNCDPSAYNSSGASGLLQIMPMWADDCGGSPSDLFDPWFNLTCGLHVYAVQGWGAWSTY